MKPIQSLLIPGGFRAATEQTAAVQALLGGARRAPARKKTRAKKKRPAARRVAKKRPVKRRASAKPARLVKGSAAAKRHMAKLRRMRKK